MTRTLTRHLIHLTLALCCAPLALAAEPAALTASATVSTPERAAPATGVPLARFMATSGPIRLEGAAGRMDISLPVSARETVQHAQLRLVATNSVSLLGERSQLAVRLNGRTVVQLPLSPRQPEIVADIRLPVALLKPGYNTLSFVAAQHYSLQCEDPAAPELWTEIDTVRSTLTLDTALKPITPVLADLPDLLAPTQSPGEILNIVTPGLPQPALLAAGGIVAQGAALRLRYLPLTVRHASAQVATPRGAGALAGLDTRALNGDAVLIGTLDALKPYLAADVATRIKGAFLAIYPMPSDPKRFVILVSGRNDAEVASAASAFAWQSTPFPRQAELNVAAIRIPEMPDYAAGGRIAQPGSYRFSDLGFSTRSVEGTQAQPLTLTMSLPADTYAPEDAYIELALDFAQGARMRNDSVLNIFLNGNFQQVVPLDEERGGLMQRYRVRIPLRDFKPGSNTLTFSPRMTPQQEGACATYQTGNLQFTLFDSSLITLPQVFHFTLLPDLQRFALSGFPYTVRSSGEQLGVWLASRDSDTIAAAWTLLGKLSQRKSIPLTQVRYGYEQPAGARHTLLLGASDRLPVAALKGAPWLPGRHFTQPALSNQALPVNNPGWLSSTWHWLSGGLRTSLDTPTIGPVAVDGNARLDGQLLTMQYRSPFSSKSTLTVFTSDDPAALSAGMARLVDPRYWDNLRGDVALVSQDRDTVTWQQVGARYEYGGIGLRDRLGFYFSQHPWLWFVLTVILLVLLAALVARLIRLYHRRIHRNVAEQQEPR
ncbi:cellulose biosynthesis cyclic di-GMP-binding regulatory protein BcsB [Chitiniphilus eburneus]|uniref:Cyclic di-GMP-binding protein n=1 Tax=Chitiniphilus eburneus TaxID=2571148 RepID=A0A4U0QJN0_9NEIS|nr:cellulose biosynthesis cyclic di-GMP-binding regulatory protein BcsB [Chitiniphilus eburneus]TJZ76274.1 cellulose biosynthesis cyclic di-GMP-binding regulatory protein BcsB [Chitiniphilus eburneus]